MLTLVNNYIRHIKGLRLTAKNSKNNDIYIVEFPKSGVTWLSCILANVALLESKRQEIANYTSTKMYIADIHMGNDISDSIYSTPPVRFIKSHAKYNYNYRNIIYLSREPADVMKSYYNYLIGYGKIKDIDFQDFYKNKKYGIHAWKKHVNSWLTPAYNEKAFHLIKYEDLLLDTKNEIHNLNLNFGWNLNAKHIDTAIERSSLSTMKASEDIHKSYNPKKIMTFINSSKTPENFLEIKDEINRLCKAERELLGYI